jgi:CheY-like chemotaxis protein
MRVLIVEDERMLAEVFRDLLAGLGHNATVTSSAEAALERLANDPPDAILLDVRLPGMSGIDFLGLPAVQESGVPVVAVSGAVGENDARECLKRGALDFLRKPVTLDRLSDVLAYLEPFALAKKRVAERRGLERRPAPRAAVDLPVRIVDEKKRAWSGTCIQLSATGMKARTTAHLRAGKTVRLAFTPPDGGVPLDVVAIAVRLDKDGAAFWFLDLMSHDTQRLRALVDRLRL